MEWKIRGKKCLRGSLPGLDGDKKYTLRNTALIYGYTIVNQVYLKHPIIL